MRKRFTKTIQPPLKIIENNYSKRRNKTHLFLRLLHEGFFTQMLYPLFCKEDFHHNDLEFQHNGALVCNLFLK